MALRDDGNGNIIIEAEAAAADISLKAVVAGAQHDLVGVQFGHTAAGDIKITSGPAAENIEQWASHLGAGEAIAETQPYMSPGVPGKAMLLTFVGGTLSGVVKYRTRHEISAPAVD